MSLSHDASYRLARLMFTLLMAIAWCVSPAALRADQSSATTLPGSAHDAAADAETAVNSLRRYTRALEAFDQSISRETFDPAAIVKRVGNNPDALAAWVRGETSWIPYLGALRGPIGVLMDRKGNSLDRALTLAELLRVAGRQVRLAHAELTQAAAERLVAGVATGPLKSAPDARPSGQLVESLIQGYGRPFQLDEANLRRVAEEQVTNSERKSEDIISRSSEQQQAVLEWLKLASTSIGDVEKAKAPPVVSDADRVITALRDHWWIQYKDGEKWIDADLLADGKQQVGQSPDRTINWEPTGANYPVDAKLCHEVAVRVVIERWLDGTLKQQNVLSTTLHPSELLGQRIEFGNIAMQWPSDLDLSKEADPPGKLKSVALAQNEWVPALQIGTRPVYQNSFRDSGTVAANPNLDALANLGSKGVGTAAKSALDALSPNDAVAKPEPGVLTGQWIEFEIRSPGHDPRVIRREVFDLIGPAARSVPAPVPEPAIDANVRLNRALALQGQTEILLSPCQLSDEYVGHLRCSVSIGWRDPLIALIRSRAAAPGANEKMPQLTPGPSGLYDIALARHRLNQNAADLFIDSPQVLLFHKYLRVGTDQKLIMCMANDIVTHELAARPGLGADANALRAEQGIIDSNVETILMDESGRLPNISDYLSAHTKPDDWLIVRSRSAPEWQKLQIDKDTRARVDADLSQGYVVALPRAGSSERPGTPVGWWRIDPKSGDVLGMGAQGWGVEMAEYALVSGTFFFGCILTWSAVAYDPAMSQAKMIEGRNKALAVCLFAGVGGALMAGAMTGATILGALILGVGTGRSLV